MTGVAWAGVTGSAPRQETRPGRRRQLHPHYLLAPAVGPRAHFTDLGPDWHDRLAPQRRKHQLIAELERLSGKKVTLHDAAWHPAANHPHAAPHPL